MKLKLPVLVLAALLIAGALGPAWAEEEVSAFHKDAIANLQFTTQRLIQLAEATPENMFGWRPTKDVRTVSEVYMHVVGTNMLLPPALGAAPPEGLEMDGNPFAVMQEWEATVTTKDAVIAKLKESLAYASKALTEIQDLEAEVQLFGPPQSKRAYIMIVFSHAHEHLGQSIAYARSMGVVPPWSQPADGGADSDDADAGDGQEGNGE